MKVVCLVLAGTVVAQNLQRLSQVRILCCCYCFQGLPQQALRLGNTPTAWEYRCKYLVPTADLYRAGIHPVTSLRTSMAALCILRSN